MSVLRMLTPQSKREVVKITRRVMRLSFVIDLYSVEVVRRREVSAHELTDCARRMLEAVNPRINAVVETYPEALAGSDDPSAPFFGVPFAVKDRVLHAAGQRMLQAADGLPLHLAHVQFYAYGSESKRGFSSGAQPKRALVWPWEFNCR